MNSAVTLTKYQNFKVRTGLAPQIPPAVEPGQPLFDNPFKLEDMLVFDDETLREMVDNQAFGLKLDELALSLHGAEKPVVDKVTGTLIGRQRQKFLKELNQPAPVSKVEAARQRILDGLFWELTYWKTPELYEELTEGENLHPGIFKQLRPSLRGKTLLDAGAGSGRASFEALRNGAKMVYAVEPSPGLLNILEAKTQHQPRRQRIVPMQGRFDKLPLDNNSVDVALSCSAFTAEAEQGGDAGLEELIRVTRNGGKIVIIWPRREDHDWLQERGFKYIALPIEQEMKVRFRSLESARRCASRFYARNQAVINYLRRKREAEVPFSVLGFNPPHDYCWLEVSKSRKRAG